MGLLRTSKIILSFFNLLIHIMIFYCLEMRKFGREHTRMGLSLWRQEKLIGMNVEVVFLNLEMGILKHISI